MNRPSWTLAFLVGALATMPADVHAQTFKVTKYNIGGEGGTDYITAEAGTRRVFDWPISVTLAASTAY